MWVIIRNHSYEDIKKQLYNYKLGFLKNYLQFIQKNLKANWYSCIIASEYDKEEMKKLSKTTLYIPDYIKIQYNGWTGEDKENEKPNDLFKDYDFEYEWISSKDLNKKIFSTKEDFYYLMYTKINSTKIISIINGKTGDIIYTDFQSLSYQLKPKDLKKINRKIH
ncbi:hypothetical protein [Flavobacterium sp.]|uniref:hypothetical protein n=1 Tax=Flavobacterium sp. TaxID=239 RepID=UPI004048930D